MKLFLNKTEVNKDIFIVNNGLNYGRFFDRKTEVFEIQLTKLEIINLLESDYNEARDEIKHDDALYNETSEFTNTNYCEFTELLNHELDFEEIMKTYLHITLLSKIVSETTQKRYVINSTDSIKITNNIISIKGRVFELTKISR